GTGQGAGRFGGRPVASSLVGRVHGGLLSGHRAGFRVALVPVRAVSDPIRFHDTYTANRGFDSGKQVPIRGQVTRPESNGTGAWEPQTRRRDRVPLPPPTQPGLH